jgi:ubiquinone biosynthesis protein COQ4
LDIPSLAWFQDRLKQLQQNSIADRAALTAMTSLMQVFYCQFTELNDFGAIAQMNRDLIGTTAQANLAKALKADPASAALISTRYLPPAPAWQVLMNCPRDSLGYTYGTFCQNSELYADLYSDIVITSDESYIEARLSQTHDIWHILTGFGTSVEDELGLQAFYLAQFPYPAAAMLIANALVSYTLLEPEHLPQLLAAIEQGWQQGKQAKPLFPQKWENLWQQPLNKLRSDLNLKHPEITPKP